MQVMVYIEYIYIYIYIYILFVYIPDTCIIPFAGIVGVCNSDYKIYLEDRGNYDLSWKSLINASTTCCSSIRNAFAYKSIYELKVC